MTNVLHVDFARRTRASSACVRCAAPIASAGACANCASVIAADGTDSEVRRARLLNLNNRCAHCKRSIDARTLLALLPNESIVYHLGCYAEARS